jgi:hypothetical protein
MKALSWKRWLLVTWTAFSACWVLGWGWYYDLPSCAELHPGEIEGSGWHCHGPLSSEGGYETVPLLIVSGKLKREVARFVVRHRYAAAREMMGSSRMGSLVTAIPPKCLSRLKNK